MKKSSLLALSLASLVGLVGCNKQPSGGNKYAKEERLVKNVVNEFFGAGSDEYVDSGAEVVYLGKDSTTGEEIYGPGAAFDVIFWDSYDEQEGAALVDYDSVIGTIGYNVNSETSEYEAPAITALMEENGLNFNYTQYAWNYGSDYLFDEGGELYFKYQVTSLQTGDPLGWQLCGVYLTLDEQYNILMRLDVELMTVNIARSDLVTFFGEQIASSINATGYFQDEKINILTASVAAFNPQNLN